MTNHFTSAFRQNMVRAVFAFILVSFSFRYYNQVMLHQLLQPVIVKTESDLAYWLYHLSGVAKLIVQDDLGSLLFDCLLVGLGVSCLLWPSRRFLIVIFSLLYPLYFISYNAFVTHHTGTMDGILLITLAFWTTKGNTFLLLWEALRYFTLSIYSLAFFWKVFIGISIFSISQPMAIVQENLALYLYHNPGTGVANGIGWFLQHPVILYVGYTTCIVMQGGMLTGFFTKRYDYLLFLIPFVFHLATYFFVDVCYFELLILNFTFLRPGTLSKQPWWPRPGRQHLVTSPPTV